MKMSLGRPGLSDIAGADLDWRETGCQSNEIGFAAMDRRIGAVEIKAAINDVGLMEVPAQ